MKQSKNRKGPPVRTKITSLPKDIVEMKTRKGDNFQTALKLMMCPGVTE